MKPWWLFEREERYLQKTSAERWPSIFSEWTTATAGWPAWEQQWADEQGLGINGRNGG